MEALVGVTIALLTIYDMCKAVDKEMRISDVRLVEKTKRPVDGESMTAGTQKQTTLDQAAAAIKCKYKLALLQSRIARALVNTRTLAGRR